MKIYIQTNKATTNIFGLHTCGTAALAVGNLEDALLATASAVIVCANYIYYAIFM